VRIRAAQMIAWLPLPFDHNNLDRVPRVMVVAAYNVMRISKKYTG
jgi:hypothetical protein